MSTLKSRKDKIKQFDKLIGYWKPKRQDIKEEAKNDIGRFMLVEAAWIADKEYSNGKYAGQWVLTPMEGSLSHLSFPEEDFKIIQKL
jgi:hypothetical protein